MSSVEGIQTMTQAPLPSRIAEISPDHYTTEQAAVIAALLAGRGKLLSPYKIWIHSPRVAEAMERLGTFLNKQSSLSPREVELGICLTAHHWQGDYVWQAHVKRCLELGIKQAVFDDIRAGNVPAFDTARERMLYDVAMIAQQPGPGSDEVFDRAIELLGREGLAEYLCLLGYYSAVAIAMKIHRVPRPGG
jgi:4-carboxymuconolactone decarboxylase